MLPAAWLWSPSSSCCPKLGFNDRFKDHYLVAPQSTVSMLIMLAFTYIAPEVGVLFLCTLFIVFSFSVAAFDAARRPR